jgi:hypothetical protein
MIAPDAAAAAAGATSSSSAAAAAAGALVAGSASRRRARGQLKKALTRAAAGTLSSLPPFLDASALSARDLAALHAGLRPSYARAPPERPVPVASVAAVLRWHFERPPPPPSPSPCPAPWLLARNRGLLRCVALVLVRGDGSDEEDAMYRGEEWRGGVAKSALEQLREKVAKRELKAVDHSAIDYLPIRKALYVESREVAAMSALEVAAARDALEVKLRGRNVPRPLSSWEQSGLPARALDALAKPHAAP